MPGKLVYYDVNGRAECIRSLLAHAQFQYDDDRPMDLVEYKAQGINPYGGWPIWIEDGFTMNQSNAILRMLGIRLGYYTEDPDVAYQIDSMCDFIEDVVDIYFAYQLPHLVFKRDLGDEDTWFSKFWDRYLGVMEARLSDHGKKFIAGTERPTIADFKAAIFWPLVFVDSPENTYPQAVRDRLMQKAQSEAPHFLRWSETMK
mmetsp:Transcript_36908/g.48503  ORF Transcript_36908/g.48503 Transcript_36908/m.48503 type:complete len:202 (+) Transcript_36908:24-629(+)